MGAFLFSGSRKVFLWVVALLMALALVPVAAFALAVETATSWATLGTAVADVDSGGTVEIASDFDAESPEIILPAKTFSIDAEGGDRTIGFLPGSSYFDISSGANVTVGSTTSTLTINGNDVPSTLISNSGSLTLDNVAIVDTASSDNRDVGPIINESGATLIVNAGTSISGYVGPTGIVNNFGTMIIQGGSSSVPFYNNFGGEVILRGGLSSGQTLTIIDAGLIYQSNPYYLGAALNSGVLIQPRSELSQGTVIFEPEGSSGYGITPADLAKVEVVTDDGYYSLLLDSGNIVVDEYVSTAPALSLSPSKITYNKDKADRETTLSSGTLVAVVYKTDDLLGQGYATGVTQSDGSTKIVFSSAWLDTLANGTYSILVIEGSSPEPLTLQLTVEDAKEEGGDPDPGDDSEDPGDSDPKDGAGPGTTPKQDNNNPVSGDGSGKSADLTKTGDNTKAIMTLVLAISLLGFAIAFAGKTHQLRTRRRDQ